jgi:hypothetical protein
MEANGGPQEIEDLVKWRTWEVGGPEKMQGLRNGEPGEMVDLGKWRTWGIRGKEKMHAGLDEWISWVNTGWSDEIRTNFKLQ